MNLSLIFDLISHFSWLIFILVIVGFFKTPPAIFVTFTFFVKVFIALFLIYRFNPYHKVVFNDLDRRLAFSAGGLILLFSFTDYVAMFLDQIKSIVQTLLPFKNLYDIRRS